MSRTLLAVAVAGLVLSACGDATEPDDPGATGVQTLPVLSPSPESTNGGVASATIQVASSGLGEILVDGDGRTVYVFDADQEGESTCYDECATNWPALAGPAEAGAGTDAALLGTTVRDDGSEQATYNGRPLYHFAGDQAPGDTSGQGVGGVWWVVGADGEAIEAAANGDFSY